MANTIKIGNAGFKYTEIIGGANITFNLAAPLRKMRPIRTETRFKVTALDNKTSEVITISGSEVEEIVGIIRYEDDPPGLLDMLNEGANGAILTYYPDLSTPGENYPAELVEPSGNNIQLELDRDFGRLGLREVEIRLRRIDGGNFDNLLQV